jgi:hypothetical protein
VWHNTAFKDKFMPSTNKTSRGVRVNCPMLRRGGEKKQQQTNKNKQKTQKKPKTSVCPWPSLDVKFG